MNIDILRNISLFSAIKESDLEKLIAGNHIYQKHYMKGTTVHNANETCRTLDNVLSGSLVAYSLSINGSATTMFEFSQGSVIGANLLFGENHSYPLNIYCLTDCQIIHIDINAVLEFLHDYNFTLHYIKIISQNSQGINQKIASPVFSTPVHTATSPETPLLILPITFAFSVSALSGQTKIQPPQEWHTSSKTISLFLI